MSGKRIFHYFTEQNGFLLSDFIIFIFLFSAAPSKMITSGKVYFSSFVTLWKSDFSETAYFHSFALSDCGESISNLRKDTFAESLCGYYSVDYSAREIHFAKLFPIS